MKVDIKKQKVVNEAILDGNSVTEIFNKLHNFYKTQYGDIDFKELILYTCNSQDCIYMINIIRLMPELKSEDSNNFIRLLKLYAETCKQTWPMSENDAVHLFDMMCTEFTISNLIKENKIKIDDTNHGDWILKLNQ